MNSVFPKHHKSDTLVDLNKDQFGELTRTQPNVRVNTLWNESREEERSSFYEDGRKYWAHSWIFEGCPDVSSCFHSSYSIWTVSEITVWAAKVLTMALYHRKNNLNCTHFIKYTFTNRRWKFWFVFHTWPSLSHYADTVIFLRWLLMNSYLLIEQQFSHYDTMEVISDIIGK